LSRAPLRLALLGCGRIARAHAAAIVAQPQIAQLVAVADADPAAAAALAARHSGTRVVTDLDALLASEDVEALVICTPNALHAEPSIRALDAGRHVLVEKPMAENSADAARMTAAAAAQRRIDRSQY
jgi:predicted dehydrogenase